MNKCNKGSILLEVAAAIAIVIITIMMSYKVCILMDKGMSIQKNRFNDRESINAVCSEIKYNIPFDELRKILERQNISKKYDENFLEDLSDKNLLELDDSKEYENRIVITLLSEKEEELSLEIELIDKGKKKKIKIIKEYWMDYV